MIIDEKNFKNGVYLVARLIEVGGISVIVMGILVASVIFIYHLFPRKNFEDLYDAYRVNLARAILIGLEMLLAADIILTVAIERNLTSVLALSLIVFIRTFLSFALQVEIKGFWPWQERAHRKK